MCEILALVLMAAPAAAAELQPRTVAAFDRYVRLTEARMDGGGPFFQIDPRRDELVIERLTTRDAGT